MSVTLCHDGRRFQGSVVLPSLPAVSEWYRQETACWAEIFCLSTLLLPPAHCRSIWAIDLWCRRSDGLMDTAEAQAWPVDKLTRRLDAWQERSRDLLNGVIRDGPDLVMRDILDPFIQSLQLVLAIIEDRRMDLHQCRYATYKNPRLSCCSVAGTFALMVQQVMGMDPAFTTESRSRFPDAFDAAVVLDTVSRLTDIIRDVGEDRGRSRIDLPREDLVIYADSEDEVKAGVLNGNWRALMRFHVERALFWFAHSEAGVRWFGPDVRWSVWASRRLYRGILDVIPQVNFDAFNHRAFLLWVGRPLDLPFSSLIAQSR